MKKNAYKNDILFVLISTFVVASIWVGSDIYNKSVSSTLNKTLEFQIQPIPGNFDMKTIERTRSRIKVDPLNQGVAREASSEAILKPTPEVEVLPVEKSASSGGVLGI